MSFKNLDPFLSLKLVGHRENFNFLQNLLSNNFPKTLLLSGKSGIGKLTLVIHFLNYLHSKSNYNISEMKIDNESNFYQSVFNRSQENIIFLNLSKEKPLKIDEIRGLKETISKTLINEKKRYIIINEIETLNHNCLNALLKIIEEPTLNNYFILINNKTIKLLETIKSRCFEINLNLSEEERLNIINFLKIKFEILKETELDELYLTPGNYINFYNIIEENNLLNKDYLFSIEYLIKLYKKTGRKDYIELVKFKTESYFLKLMKQDKDKIEKFSKIQNKILLTINDYLIYNINFQSVMSSILRNCNNAK